jgi:hypothetical protein
LKSGSKPPTVPKKVSNSKLEVLRAQSSKKKPKLRRNSSKQLEQLSNAKSFKEDTISLLPVTEQLNQKRNLLNGRKNTLISEISPLIKNVKLCRNIQNMDYLENPEAAKVSGFKHYNSTRTLDIAVKNVSAHESDLMSEINLAPVKTDSLPKMGKFDGIVVKHEA